MICIDHPTPQRNRHKCSHLFDDEGDVLALHIFAEQIGLKPSWLHPRKGLPHYDVWASKIVAAIEAGAKQVDRNYVVEVLKRGIACGHG